MFDNIMGITDVLGVITQKQAMVANNIANANTPGYTAQHGTFGEMLGQVSSPFETSLSMKMGSSINLGEFAAEGEGEPVNLQHELIDLQKNNLYYNMATRRLSTIITLLKSAPQVGR